MWKGDKMTPTIEAIELMEVREDQNEMALNDNSVLSMHVVKSGNYCSDIC